MGIPAVTNGNFCKSTNFNRVCYRAAGWECLGRTTGAGLLRPGKQYATGPKLIFVKPLTADFRARLCSGVLEGGWIFEPVIGFIRMSVDQQKRSTRISNQLASAGPRCRVFVALRLENAFNVPSSTVLDS